MKSVSDGSPILCGSSSRTESPVLLVNVGYMDESSMNSLSL